MEHYDILDEADTIISQNALRKPEHINVPDKAWATANDEIKSLLIEAQQLVKSLEDAYWEAITQEDQERALLLYRKIMVRPHLLIDDPKRYDEQRRVEIETVFIDKAKLWIREVEGLL